jgi:hypothetical protein
MLGSCIIAMYGASPLENELPGASTNLSCVSSVTIARRTSLGIIGDGIDGLAAAALPSGWIWRASLRAGANARRGQLPK